MKLFKVQIPYCFWGDSFPKSVGWQTIGFTTNEELVNKLSTMRFNDAIENADWPLCHFVGEKIFRIDEIEYGRVFNSLEDVLPFLTVKNIYPDNGEPISGDLWRNDD